MRSDLVVAAAVAGSLVADRGPESRTFAPSGGPDFEMVSIRPGPFMMGSEEGDPDERPVHRVTISRSFQIGKYEVTQAQWQAVMGSNPSEFKDCPGNCPVERISWNAAGEFVRKLNGLQSVHTYRLPTEAEWEYVARAGTTTPFGIGDGRSLSTEQANFDGTVPYGMSLRGTSRGVTVAVGSFRPNAWGVHDMHGNVWEWTSDVCGAYAAADVTDPAGPQRGEFRVRRGGGWTSQAAHLRSAYRSMNAPSDHHNCGLRLARVPR